MAAQEDRVLERARRQNCGPEHGLGDGTVSLRVYVRQGTPGGYRRAWVHQGGQGRAVLPAKVTKSDEMTRIAVLRKMTKSDDSGRFQASRTRFTAFWLDSRLPGPVPSHLWARFQASMTLFYRFWARFQASRARSYRFWARFQASRPDSRLASGFLARFQARFWLPGPPSGPIPGVQGSPGSQGIEGGSRRRSRDHARARHRRSGYQACQ